MAHEHRASSGRIRYWIRHQGQEVKLIESDRAPALEQKEGEREVRLIGPFNDKTKAQERFEKTMRRTTRWQVENEGRA